ncbi:hypothetical protein SeLEV6574_g06467 [Synchytrium endobioticum]|uniref:Uncharacterized protein n=1 Tax=Synchytrium endobioticum TaxID=286115 RepID=A0A507CNJ2_9FUNG|nr:hypothetical protein SeLEV6574_g06467 [Synchytrium endobioticum]
MEHTAYAFGALCAFGGTMGYIRQRSLPSLVAGWAFGALYTASGYLIGTNAKYAVELATATSALLLVSMAPRAASTRKPVPILLTAMGSVGSAYYAKKLYQQVHAL